MEMIDLSRDLFHRTQTHPLVWNVFVGTMQRAWRDAYPDEPAPSLVTL